MVAGRHSCPTQIPKFLSENGIIQIVVYCRVVGTCHAFVTSDARKWYSSDPSLLCSVYFSMRLFWCCICFIG